MKIAVLGTGMVGKALGTKFVSLGHEVKMGSRTADHEGGTAWAAEAGDGATLATFADAAAFGEIVFNCAKGAVSLQVLEAAGAENLEGKVLVDVSNPLDFSKGMPPTLTVCNDDSMAEQIQRAHPKARVVKAFNTMNCEVMVDPSRVPGDHDVLIAGNDAEAKKQVTQILEEWLGWKHVVDVGDVTAARGLEAWLLLWIRLYGAFGTGDFNLHLAR